MAASSPVRTLVDMAQAPLPPITRLPPATMIAAPAADVVARKARRPIILFDILFPPLVFRAAFRGRLLSSAIAAVPLQNLDLVAVGILDEKELGHQRAVAMEFLDRVRVEAAFDEATMLA